MGEVGFLNMVKLSKRLQAIADCVPQGARIADIGSDHALLPVFLAEQGRVSYAVAGELNEGPRDAAMRQVQAAGVSAAVNVRLGDGLSVIRPGEVNTVTIAGMGGSLIAHILDDGRERLTGVSRLVLQPNVAEDQVRRWLLEHDWLLESERVIEEDGKFYAILSAALHPEADVKNEQLYAPRTLENGLTVEREELLQLGPLLAANPEEASIRKWEAEIAKLDHIIAGMSKGGTAAAAVRQAELEAERDRMKEVVQCLQMPKPSSN